MAEWRDESEEPTRRKRATRDGAAVGVGPSPTRARDWNLGGEASSAAAPDRAGTPGWAFDPEVAGDRVDRRFFWRVGVLVGMVAMPLLLGLFIYIVINWPERLPLVHLVVSDYDSELVGQNPLGNAEFEIWPVAGDKRFGKGLRLVRFRSPNDVSRFIGDVAVNRDAVSRWLGIHRSETKPGGPAGSRMWLISGLADVALRESGESYLQILAPSPADAASRGPGGLPLDELLRQIAESGNDGGESVQVVLLDLRSPPELAEIGRFSVAWETLVREALDRAIPPDSPTRQRIAVGVAAGDGETNWAAPELGAGVFTYFVYRGLSGEADEGGDGIVTWSELQTYLDRRVRGWCRLRRDSSQQPRWFTPQSMDPSLALYSVDRQPPEPVAPTATEPIESRLAELRDLWETHRRYRDRGAHIEFPLKWGQIEADLMLMRQQSLDPRSAHWSTLKTRVETALRRLDASVQRPITSLHEESRRSDFFAAASDEIGERLRVEAETEADDGVPGMLTSVDGVRLVAFHWADLIGRIDREFDADGAAVFEDRTRIEKQDLAERLRDIDRRMAAGQVKNLTEEIPYQEMHLMRLMLQEIDWEASAAGEGSRGDREVACLDLCRCFDLIMEIAGMSLESTYPWVEEELNVLEIEFAAALDELFCGRVKQARERCEDTDRQAGLVSRLQVLAAEATDLGRVLDRHAESQYRLGHWLAWLTRWHRSAWLAGNDEERSDAEAGLRDWADLLRTTVQVRRLRGEADELRQGRGAMLEAGRDLVRSFDRLDDRWDAFLDNVRRGQGAASDFRKIEIAIANALTDQLSRRELDQQWVKFIRDSSDSVDAEGSTDREGPTDSAGDISGLAIVRDRLDVDLTDQAELAESLNLHLEGLHDRRSDVPYLLGGSEAEDGPERWVAASDWRVRHAARWLGHHLADDEIRAIADRIANRRRMVLARWWHSQGLRVCRLGWGDGPAGGSDPRFASSPRGARPPFFDRLASLYANRIGETHLPELDLDGRYANPLRERQQRILDGVRQLTVDWGDPNRRRFDRQEKFREEQVTLRRNPASDWEMPIIGAVYVTRGIGVQAARIPFPDDQLALPWEWSEDGTEQPSRSVDIDFDWFRDGNASYHGGIRFRGHHLRVPLDYRPLDELPRWTVRFDAAPDGPSSIEIDASPSPPVFQLMLLIDCSGSMKNLMDRVRTEAESFLAILEELDGDGTLRAKVGVMLFGVRGIDDWHTVVMRDHADTAAGKRLGLRQSPDVPEVWETELGFLSRDGWAAALREFVRSRELIRPSGDTPLYAAIDRAFEKMSIADAKTRHHVIVIGDGVNETEQPITIAKLAKNLKGRGFGEANKDQLYRRLNLLLIDGSGTEGGSVLGPKSKLDELKVTLRKELGNQYDYFETADIARLHDQIRSLIPPTKVRILGADGQRELATGKLRETFEMSGAMRDGGVRIVVDKFLGEARSPGVIPVYPRQQLRLTLGGLDHREIHWQAWDGHAGQSSRWDGHVFRIREPVRDASARRLTFWLDAEPESTTAFPERPREILAEVRQIGRGGRKLGAFRVWDTTFEYHSGGPHQRVKLAELPWFEESFTGQRHRNEIAALSAELKVWVRTSPLELPEENVVVLGAGRSEERKIGDAEIRFERKGDELLVVVRTPVESQPRGRSGSERGVGGSFDWIVRLADPQGCSVERHFIEDGSLAEHRFSLVPGMQGQAIEIHVVPFDEAVAQMDHDFDLGPFPTSPAF